MALVDRLQTLVAKATDFKTRLFNMSVVLPPEEISYKDRLFKIGGSGKPALQHRFVLQISKEPPSGAPRSSDSDSRARLTPGQATPGVRASSVEKSLPIVRHTIHSVMAINDGNTEFQFGMDLKTGFTAFGELPKVDKITVTYWDFDDFPHTKFLTEKYYKQTNTNDGLLRVGYNSSTLYLTDELQEVVYVGVAITKPKSSGFNASLGMRTFSFDFVFSDISINPSSIKNFEDLMRDLN